MPLKTSILNNKEAIEEAVKKSKSKKDCLTILGLRAAGGNYKALKIAADYFGIELPDGQGKRQVTRANIGNTIPLSKVLIENSTYSNRSSLKKRCIKLGFLKNICYNCGTKPQWNNKPLVLQLEHLNGIYNDNRIKNLALLCPNCHSQTDSFAGKNSRKHFRVL